MKNQEELINALKDIFEDLDTSSFNLKTEFKKYW
tara:strand:- start:1350 stop:1451 length:102 start_codon:yes stop_codon:yes gene_type:complete